MFLMGASGIVDVNKIMCNVCSLIVNCIILRGVQINLLWFNKARK